MNGLTTEHEADWLSRWRRRAGLRTSQVDQRLGHALGTTIRYEHLGLLRVPCYEIAKMIELYRVPQDEFYCVIAAATSQLMKRR